MNSIFNRNIGVIGMGFVGLPMAVAIASAKKNYNVIGFEKNNNYGIKVCKNINNKIFPIQSEDKILKKKFIKSIKNKKFYATTDLNQIEKCSTVLVSIGFDFHSKDSSKNIIELFKKLYSILKNKTLLVVETTLPPGFSEKKILPIINKNEKKINYVYSFERIMPGENYYNSIVNNTRVYSTLNTDSKKKFLHFFSKIINIKKFPMSEINSITTCELTKVLENSYRAMNIAFIDEWVKFSTNNKININGAISEIKKRSTHSNIMRPGIGVGGYCLTKDPYFMNYSANNLFKSTNRFPFIDLSLKVNRNMPKTSVNFLKKIFKNIKKPRLLLLGISYKQNVKDLRSSPTLVLKKILLKLNYKIDTHDYFFDKKNLNNKLKINSYNGIIFCVPHNKYKSLPLSFFKKKYIYVDLSMTFGIKKIENLRKKKINIIQLGSY